MTSVIYTSTEQFPKKTFLSRWFQSHRYQHNSPPRIGVSVKVRVSFKVSFKVGRGVATRELPRRNIDPWLGLGFGLGLVLGLGANFPRGPLSDRCFYRRVCLLSLYMTQWRTSWEDDSTWNLQLQIEFKVGLLPCKKIVLFASMKAL